MDSSGKLVREYVCASCNRYPNVMDWGVKYIAFGSCCSIALFNVETKRIDHLLNKHKSHLRCVRWIVPDSLLVTCCASSLTVIWSLDTGTQQFYPLHILDDGNKTSLLVCDSSFKENNLIDTVTSANDFHLRFWSNDTFRCKVTLSNYAFDIVFINDKKFWSDDALRMIYAGADCKVVLCQLNRENVFTELFKFSGHSDWVRSIDYRYSSEKILYITSASQDNFIRIWKIMKTVEDKNSSMIEQTFLSPDGSKFVVCLETVLAGHEASVYCVKFLPSSNLSVISSSLDKSVVVWEEPVDDPVEDGIWNEKFRVGEIGGNNMGFLGISFPSKAESFSTFSAYSYNGSVHVWKFDEESASWNSDVGCGGHFDVVSDISWDIRGNYLLSTSNDETTRLHSKWINEERTSWHEMARPQIHGYLINCLSVLDELTFISGADEKVLRVFRATKGFVSNLKTISGVEALETYPQLPETAMIPPLGLSNRAVFTETQIDHEGDAMITLDKNNYLKSLNCPPSEELLMQSTLWPELHKLYGHGHEIFAVACSHDGLLIASSCKATKLDQAGLILWDVAQNFKKTQVLQGHSLTVTSIKFSYDDQMIVSVSRDRTWDLYKRNEGIGFVKAANSDKKSGIHSRIIWDVSWTPDSKYFLTASRDKKVIGWNVNNINGEVLVTPVSESILTLEESVMTIDIYGKLIDSKYLISVGLENGEVRVYTWDTSTWSRLCFSDNSILKHSLCVKKVRFAPSTQSQVLLATCGEDYMVQIFSVIL